LPKTPGQKGLVEFLIRLVKPNIAYTKPHSPTNPIAYSSMAPRLPTLLHLELHLEGVASVLPHKCADNLIKLRWILQPHKVAATFMGIKALAPGRGVLLADPFLRLGFEEARPATDHQGGKSDSGNDIPPVLGAVLHQQASGIVARKLEVFREHPGALLL